MNLILISAFIASYHDIVIKVSGCLLRLYNIVIRASRLYNTHERVDGSLNNLEANFFLPWTTIPLPLLFLFLVPRE